jgi:hypothetical protein
MALLSFVESAPRAYRLKVGNADLFRNSTEPGTTPIQSHSVNQFLASRNTYGTFKQTGLRYSSSQNVFLYLRYSRVDVVRRERVAAPDVLLFLIMRCTPTIRELIEATPISLSSPSLPVSRLLLPRSGLERSDFVHWHKASVCAVQGHVRSWGLSR